MWGCWQVKLGIPGGEAMAAAAAEMMIPLKRIGTPDEAAGAMLMLASPYATFITGQARALPFRNVLACQPDVACSGCAHTCAHCRGRDSFFCCAQSLEVTGGAYI